MASIYDTFATALAKFLRVLDEGTNIVEGPEGQTVTMPDGSQVNTFRESLRQLGLAADGILEDVNQSADEVRLLAQQVSNTVSTIEHDTNRAETASTAATVAAGLYPDTATAIAGTAPYAQVPPGQIFSVAVGDGTFARLYTHDGTTATPWPDADNALEYRSASYFDALFDTGASIGTADSVSTDGQDYTGDYTFILLKPVEEDGVVTQVSVGTSRLAGTEKFNFYVLDKSGEPGVYSEGDSFIFSKQIGEPDLQLNADSVNSVSVSTTVTKNQFLAVAAPQHGIHAPDDSSDTTPFIYVNGNKQNPTPIGSPVTGRELQVRFTISTVPKFIRPVIDQLNSKVATLQSDINNIGSEALRQVFSLQPETVERRCSYGHHQFSPKNQDLFVAGDYLFGFSTDSDTAEVRVINRFTFAEVNVGHHNAGHVAVVDYIPQAETILFCNSGDSGYDNPLIRLYANCGPTRLATEDDFFLDIASSDCITIDLPGVFGPDIGSSICRAVSANEEDMRAVYVFTGGGSSAPVSIQKLWLGTGTNDFSAEGFGTFISGKGASEFNGTAKPIGPLYQTTFPLGATSQGASWINGQLHHSITSGAHAATLEIVRYRLFDDGKVSIDKRYIWPPMSPDGTQGTIECQGVDSDGVYLYVADNNSNLYRFPLGQTMFGKAKVGDRIAFPFPGAATPLVNITATSAGSIYLDPANVDRDGFTASGDTYATFNWWAPIP